MVWRKNVWIYKNQTSQWSIPKLTVLSYSSNEQAVLQYKTYMTNAKRCANGRSDFWLSIKSVWNTLSCCCFVCAFIIGQYHSGNNMSSKSEAAGEILFFWKWKAPRNSTPENGHAHGEYFRCFRSRTWRIKTLPQSLICTEEISLYTVHIKSIISKFCFWN